MTTNCKFESANGIFSKNFYKDMKIVKFQNLSFNLHNGVLLIAHIMTSYHKVCVIINANF